MEVCVVIVGVCLWWWGLLENVICKEVEGSVEEEEGNNGFQLSKFIERIDWCSGVTERDSQLPLSSIERNQNTLEIGINWLDEA